MKKTIACICITAVLLLNIAPFASASSEMLELYVSATAEQNGDGSFENPFSGIIEARDYIRKLRKAGQYPKGGITVYIKEGSYSNSEGFDFDGQDSGDENAPVIYTAYGEDNVSLTSGAVLKLSDFQLLTDTSVLSKMDSSVNGKIYSINLKDRGIAGYDGLYVTGHASNYTIKYGLSEKGPAVPELFFNDEVMTLARYPNGNEWMMTGKVVDSGENMTDWWNSETNDKSVPPRPATFIVPYDRITRWINAKNAWVQGYWNVDWSDQCMEVGEIDAQAKTLTFGLQTWAGISEGRRWYIYNLIEELDAPGEWFYDTETGELYIYPQDTNKNNSITLGFSSDSVLNVNGASNIQFKRLSVKGSRSNGAVITKCENVSLSHCSIGNVTGYGVIIETSKNSSLKSSTVFNTGGRGVSVSGGDKINLTPSNNSVVNNNIHDFGRITRTYQPGISIGGVGNYFAHNLIYNGYHVGVSGGGNDNIFEYNEIHSVMKEASDMGAIYFNCGMTNRGNVLRYNYIHDIYSNSTQDAVYGVYLDNASSGITVTNNMFTNIGLGGPEGKGDAVFINGGRDNTVTDNICANLRYSVNFIASALSVSWGWYTDWLNGKRTYGLVGENIDPYTNEAYAKYPHMTNIMDDNPPYPKYNVIKNIVSYNVSEAHHISAMEAQKTGITLNDLYEVNEIEEGISTKTDIGFKDIKNNDFSLTDDSMVYKELMDFDCIDISEAGLITAKLRTVLSDNAIALCIGKPAAYVNWKRRVIDEDNYNQTPFILNDKTYVPVRFLFEAARGASVEYNDGVITVNDGSSIIELKPGEKTATVNENEREIEEAPIIIDGRTYVPLRAIAELLNKKVFWDDVGVIVLSEENLTEHITKEMCEELKERL